MDKKYYGDKDWEEPNEIQDIKDSLKSFDDFEEDNKNSELMKDELSEEPTYEDLKIMLQDCIQVLKISDVEENMIETWSNVLMNAENMILQIIKSRQKSSLEQLETFLKNKL